MTMRAAYDLAGDFEAAGKYRFKLLTIGKVLPATV